MSILEAVEQPPQVTQGKLPVLEEGAYELDGGLFTVRQKGGEMEIKEYVGLQLRKASYAMQRRLREGQGQKLDEGDFGKRTYICEVCHRRLTDPKSIARGIGPVCQQHRSERVRARRINALEQNAKR